MVSMKPRRSFTSSWICPTKSGRRSANYCPRHSAHPVDETVSSLLRPFRITVIPGGKQEFGKQARNETTFRVVTPSNWLITLSVSISHNIAAIRDKIAR